MCIDEEELAELALSLCGREDSTHECSAKLSHLRECGCCRSRFSEYMGTVDAAKKAVAASEAATPASECLGDEDLAGYLDNALKGAKRAAIEEHLARCTYCVRQLRDLVEITRQVEPVRPGAAHFVLGLAASGLRFLSHPVGLEFHLSTPEPVAVLGGAPENADDLSNAHVWVQQVGKTQLEFTAVQVDPSHINLTLNVSHTVEIPKGARLTLWRDGRLMQSDPIAEGGGIEISSLDLNTYEGEVQLASGETIPFAISLRPTGD